MAWPKTRFTNVATKFSGSSKAPCPQLLSYFIHIIRNKFRMCIFRGLEKSSRDRKWLKLLGKLSLNTRKREDPFFIFYMGIEPMLANSSPPPPTTCGGEGWGTWGGGVVYWDILGAELEMSRIRKECSVGTHVENTFYKTLTKPFFI